MEGNSYQLQVLDLCFSLFTCSDLMSFKYVETFYQGTFRNLKCDGNSPVNGWENIKDPAIHKPGPLFNGIGGRVTLPIDKLIHITHDAQAKRIEKKNRRSNQR